MRFGFTMDGYEILAVKNFVEPVPFLRRLWARVESNHYKKRIQYQTADVMLHIRLPWLYHTNLWVQDRCYSCGKLIGKPTEVSRKLFKAMAKNCHPDGNVQQHQNIIHVGAWCDDCYQAELERLYSPNPDFNPD